MWFCKKPILKPAALRIEAIIAAVLPLPLVPVTWIAFSFFSGLSSLYKFNDLRT
jgi:hypothetical protein